MNEIQGSCPICQNKCKIRKEDNAEFKDAVEIYACKQCGQFILPILIAYLVGDIKRYEKYKDSAVYDNTYDRDKMIVTLRDAIENYGNIARSLNRDIRFCYNEKDKKKGTRDDDYIYLTWDAQYHVKKLN